MFGVCMLYAKDQTAAEDILQEGFIKVFKKINQYRFEGSFEGWMRKIMVNTALERFRKHHYLYPVEEIEGLSEEIVSNDAEHSITATEMAEMINELTPQYQMVFNLYAIEGYTHQEISQKLGITEGTSKSNLSRARKILQDKVKKNFGDRFSADQMRVIQNM